MTTPAPLPPGDCARHLLLITTPALWPAWPFLPVVRRTPGAEDLGVMFDARGVCGRTGYSATVFRALCGAPHKARYADWRTMRTLLDAL